LCHAESFFCFGGFSDFSACVVVVDIVVVVVVVVVVVDEGREENLPVINSL
jgi:hypothetical protein